VAPTPDARQSAVQPHHVAALALGTLGWPHAARPQRITLQALIVDLSHRRRSSRPARPSVRLIVGPADLVCVRGECARERIQRLLPSGPSGRNAEARSRRAATRRPRCPIVAFGALGGKSTLRPGYTLIAITTPIGFRVLSMSCSPENCPQGMSSDPPKCCELSCL